MAVRRPVEEPCTVKGCTQLRRSRTGMYCRQHGDRLRRSGSLEGQPSPSAESVRSSTHTSDAHTSAPAERVATVTMLSRRAGRQTRQQSAAASVRATVRSDGKLGGFDLPDNIPDPQSKTGDALDWHPHTREWWEAWRRSPRALGR